MPLSIGCGATVIDSLLKNSSRTALKLDQARRPWEKSFDEDALKVVFTLSRRVSPGQGIEEESIEDEK
jgi:hypothetical protein